MLGEDGIINKAKEAANSMNNAISNDQASLTNVGDTINGMINGLGVNGETNTEAPEGIIPETNSYVGYYADREGDGTVDGIIFADLSKGNTGDGKWMDDRGLYTIPIKDNLKEYNISKNKHTDDFGENYVITPKKGTTGNERFYIMALENIENIEYYWYKSANGKMIIDTSEDFEQGKQNTQTMITQWNDNKYPPQDENDMWKKIQKQVNSGWFVPSRAEWSAFAEELEITKDNYVNYNLDDGYWSSSQDTEHFAWLTFFKRGNMCDCAVTYRYFVRLASTF